MSESEFQIVGTLMHKTFNDTANDISGTVNKLYDTRYVRVPVHLALYMFYTTVYVA